MQRALTYFDEVTTAAKDFTEQTGIPVTVSEPSNMSDDLALALSSGETPDIVSILFMNLYSFISRNI